LISVLLGSTVVFHGALLVFSLVDPSFAVVPDYEGKAARWDEAKRELEESRALGWMVDLRTRPAGPGYVEVSLEVFDRYGKPVRASEARVEAFHIARASERLGDRLSRTEDGRYVALMPLGRPGLWEFRLTVERDSERYVGVVRKDVEIERSGGRAVGGGT
jgi:nitrogen fixation protein FixH